MGAQAIKDYRIDTRTGRRRLTPRREPYWRSVGPGRALGLRLSTPATSHSEPVATWILRWKPSPKGSYRYHSLGPLADHSFEEAVELATEFLRAGGTIRDRRYTVAKAVAAYVRKLRAERGESAATDAEQRLNKHVIPVLGDVRLADLTTDELLSWRDGMVVKDEDPEMIRRSKDTANRTLSSLKAALNYAHATGRVASNAPWSGKVVSAFPRVSRARTQLLTRTQIRALLAQTDGALHDLVKAGVLTGARAGELQGARVKDLDTRHGTLRLNGKTGVRDVQLSSEAFSFLKKLASDKLPEAYLLPKDDGTPWKRSEHSRAFAKAVQTAELPSETVFYSLRHYALTQQLLAGVPAVMVAKNAGTSVRMLEVNYSKHLNAQLRDHLDEVALL